MKRSKLILQQDEYGNYHAIFKTEHGRKVYLAVSLGADRICKILECVYIDRHTPCFPKKQVTKTVPINNLLELIRMELDKNFSEAIWLEEILSRDSLIESFQKPDKKKILLFLKEGNVIRTIFKSRVYRAILLEVRVSDGVGLITRCHYCDKRDQGRRITPHGLTTIFFPYSLKRLLEIVNNELEGGFTDVIISDDHTVALDRPICGWI